MLCFHCGAKRILPYARLGLSLHFEFGMDRCYAVLADHDRVSRCWTKPYLHCRHIWYLIRIVTSYLPSVSFVALISLAHGDWSILDGGEQEDVVRALWGSINIFTNNQNLVEQDRTIA